MKFILFLTVFFSLNGHSNEQLKARFKNEFKTNYVETKCGDNIIGFVKRARNAGIILENAKIIEIVNKGFSVFGMINVEYAREGGRFNPNSSLDGFRNLPGEKNWYHHVILEQDGNIYDFDYGNSPVVDKTKKYFDKMFLIESSTDQSFQVVGKEEKRKTYELTVRDALDTVHSIENRLSYPKGQVLKLGNFLDENL